MAQKALWAVLQSFLSFGKLCVAQAPEDHLGSCLGSFDGVSGEVLGRQSRGTSKVQDSFARELGASYGAAPIAPGDFSQ